MSDFADSAPPDWRSFEIEQIGDSTGHCDCCGFKSKRVWGNIWKNNATVGHYIVGWTEGQPDHGAAFDLVLGDWDVAAQNQDRYIVALNYRSFRDTSGFMVVDESYRVVYGSDLAATVLKRSDVVGTPLAPQVFALVDAIYMGDTRLMDVRAWNDRHDRNAPPGAGGR